MIGAGAGRIIIKKKTCEQEKAVFSTLYADIVKEIRLPSWSTEMNYIFPANSYRPRRSLRQRAHPLR